MRYSWLLALMGFALTLSSQNTGTIAGQVKDQEQKPMDGTIVSLLKADRTTLVKTAFTEANGKFEFNGLALDTFLLLVQTVSYQNYLSNQLVLSDGNRRIYLDSIVLVAEGTKLQEVTVTTSQIPFVERKIDRTVVNPDALITNAGGNALDVLAKSPGILIGDNGDIKLKGKSGVLVLVDDKPTYVSGDELEAYLKSIPSSSIKQIEIMVNPPAKYDAAGNSGIINIKTKKNKLAGMNGSASVAYGQGRYPRTNDNLALNFTNKRISVNTNLSYGLQNGFHNLTIERRYKNQDLSPQSEFTQNTYIRRRSESYNASLGMDYYCSDKTTMGLVAKGVFVQSTTGKYNYAQLLNADQSLQSVVIADNPDRSNFQNGAFNLNLRHNFDSLGKNLSVDADYVRYFTRIQQNFRNDVLLPDGTPVYHDEQTGNLPSYIQIYAMKADYTNPLRKYGRVDAGLKTSYTNTDNDAAYSMTLNGETSDNYNLSNHFLYKEMINAGYMNYAGSFKRLDVQAGIRFEATRMDGHQLGNPVKPASTFNRSYNNLFPTLYLSYGLDSASVHVLSFSYGKRVNRPFFKDLNPFTSPLDKYTFYEGNPYLKPTFANHAGLSYTYKNMITLTASYDDARDQIQETIEIKNGIYYSRPGNIGRSELYNLSLEGSIPATKWLTANFYTEVQHSHYQSKLYTETLNSRGTYWFVSGSGIFQFKKGWGAELSGEYITNFIDSQFAFGDLGHFNVGLQKKILKNMGNVKVGVNDMLWTDRIRGRINNLYLTDATWHGFRDTRVVTVSFSYRFGTNSAKSTHNGNSAEAEQNRVKA